MGRIAQRCAYGTGWLQASLFFGVAATLIAGIVAQYKDCTGNVETIGDNVCEDLNNNEACNYDGGDCCRSTCFDDESSTTLCNWFADPKKCFDPAAIDYNPRYMNCAGDFWDIGNAECDAINNNEACNFDDGDCCSCTCIDWHHNTCGIAGEFNCLDPDAGDCKTIGVVVPCAPVLQRDWVVEDTSDAYALAEAISDCSDGVFEVQWRGHVSVNRTIHVTDRTSLKVIGAVGGAVVDGMWMSRPFAVENASLILTDLEVINGVAPINNSYGGAIFVATASIANFTGTTTFRDNKADFGGALVVGDGSVVSWDDNHEATTVVSLTNNSAVLAGGAIYLYGSSTVRWSGTTTKFTENYSAEEGGAVFLSKSSLYSTISRTDGATDGGLTSFDSNNAWLRGGALMASHGSTVSFRGENTMFTGNSAKNGGAVYLKSGSNVSFSSAGMTSFARNNATVWTGFRYTGFGGAVIIESAYASWGDGGGSTTFVENIAGDNGGAVRVENGSCVWTGTTRFIGNKAISAGEGGALFAWAGSVVSWNGGDTLFSQNTAEIGGAVFVSDGASVMWQGGVTKFEGNQAFSEGGALGSIVRNPTLSVPLIRIGGDTSFVDNICDGNGGAMALNGAIRVMFGAESAVVFSGNFARSGGGAIFLLGTTYGLAFLGVNFTSNSAAVGGGVYSTASGTAAEWNFALDKNVEYPTTYRLCSFTDNSAISTGGAIETAAGKDEIMNSTFRGNSAGFGGAFRTAGAATVVVGCSFYNNVANENGGPAVVNIGSTTLKSCVFAGNIVSCEPETFLDFSQGDRYETVCSGCPECEEGCDVEDDNIFPACTEVLENSESVGLNVTLETLQIAPGYWRATSRSRVVRPCYKTEACIGGLTGAKGYCREGYEGPYCSVCSEGYVTALAFSCFDCSGYNAVLIAAVIGVVATVAVVAAVLRLVSKEAIDSSADSNTNGGALVSFRHRRLCLQPLKIVIVAWQIVTQFASVVNVTYPRVYQRFLDCVELFSFDLGSITPVGCFVGFDFHDRLLASTIAPIVVLAALGVTYNIARWRIGGGATDESLRSVRHRHVSAILLVLFLVYSSVSSVLFRAFACETLEDERNYLRADYRIECDSDKHRYFKLYAALMILVYPLGIPLVFAALLFSNRRVLSNKHNDNFSFCNRDNDLRVQPISDLWKPYTPKCFYYEVIECFRRVSLTGIVVFIFPNTAAQIAVTLMVAFVFNVIAEGLAPYESTSDAWIFRIGHAVIFISMYLALLLKVNISTESSQAQEVFAGVLVTAHICLLLVAFFEVVTTGFALVREQAGVPVVPRAIPIPLPRSTRRGSCSVLLTGNELASCSDSPIDSGHFS